MTTFARRTNRLWLLSRVLIVALAALPMAQQASASTPYGLPSLPAMGEIMALHEKLDEMRAKDLQELVRAIASRGA